MLPLTMMMRGSFTNSLKFRRESPALPRPGALPWLPSAPPFGEAPAQRFPSISSGVGESQQHEPGAEAWPFCRRVRI